MAETKNLQHMVALEEIKPNHLVAWALALPGCFSSGSSSKQAIAQTPEQNAVYIRWLHIHDPNIPITSHLIHSVWPTKPRCPPPAAEAGVWPLKASINQSEEA